MTTACLVTQRLGVYSPDGLDADELPDWVPISGKVKFMPNILTGDSFLITDADGKRTSAPKSYTADIIDGVLSDNGTEGIRLFAAGPNSNPEKLSYTARYLNLTANGDPVTLRDFAFEVSPGGHVDLTDATPVAGTPAMGITRGEPGPAPYIGDNGNWWVDGKDLGVDTEQWMRRELLDEHLDTITQPGAYGVSQPTYITAANGYPRTTGVEYGVTLQVMRTNPANPNTYQQELTYTDGEKWTRSRYGAHTWSQWSSPSASAVKYRGVLTADMNIDELRFQADDGPWRVLGAAIAQALNLPDPGAGDFGVRWIAGSGSPYATQTWIPVTTGVQWTRANNSYGWTSWKAGPPIDPAKLVPPMTAEARREQLIASRGGRIGTGGRGVVAFRFDHNVRPFQEKILPLLRARGLPGSMAHFVDEMTPQPGYTGSDEVGKTWADVTKQFFQGIEVWSHSWSHTDAATEQTLQKEIVESRTALESRIPEASVVGWMQPGMLGSRYMGYGDVFNTPEQHGTTRAGQLIEATYGADDRTGTNTSLPGSRHFGCLWIDTATSALATIGAIDEAARTGLGVVIALHASQVDATGGISTATLTAILDHVVALRDQEKIAVLSVGGLTVAETTSSWRQVLSPSLPSWAGWTSTTEGGKSGTPSSGTLSTSFSLGNHPYLKGHLRELVVTATGTGTITMRVVDRTGVSALDVSRTVQVDSGVTTHMPFGIARTNNGLRVEIICTTGAVTIHDARIQSV